MKILITGSAGFIGSNLAKHYLDLGDEVVGIDNFLSSRGDSKHFHDLLTRENYRHLYNDISKIHNDRINLWLRNQEFDVILNFACPASPPKYQQYPLETIDACTIGVKNMLDLAVENNAIFLQASTSEVYGDPDISHKTQNEIYWGNVNPYGPRGCYDNSKRLSETLCYEYRGLKGVDTRIIRIFNTYGDNMDPYDGRVITNFVKQALRKELITVYGSGNQTRSFCFIDDLIDGISRVVSLIENDGTPINLGNPHEYEIKYVAEMIMEMVPGSQGITHLSLPINDPCRRRPDIQKALHELNWSPKISLQSGLERMIPYMKNVLQK